jgi:ElaB/YqjD/DUF883 family membrane-anchored ribosome-binding protein
MKHHKTATSITSIPASVAEAFAGARKRALAGAKSADTAIRGNPYQATAIAAGIGLLLGVLVGRRTK